MISRLPWLELQHAVLVFLQHKLPLGQMSSRLCSQAKWRDTTRIRCHRSDRAISSKQDHSVGGHGHAGFVSD